MGAAADLLGHGGPFARELPGFTPRAAQQEMADAVAAAIDGREALIAEAGTGTGKTFAYLVPALISGRRVIISTGTKALQDQLFRRDLPRVRRVLGVQVKAALLKGRANYLCHYRLDQARAEGPAGAEAALLAELHAWSRRTVDGDRAGFPALGEDSPLWTRVTSTADNCLGSECPFFDDCFVVRARRAAQEADLVVVNHHLLFADFAIRQEGFGEILPGAHAFIVDEAHQVPELAGQFFAINVSTRQLGELARDALTECNGVSGALAVIQPEVAALQQALSRLRLAFTSAPPRGPLPDLSAEDEVGAAWGALHAALEGLAAAIGSQSIRSPGMEALNDRAGALRERLQAATARSEGRVLWYEQGEQNLSFNATPLDLAPPLREMRQRSGAAWIFTSATLSVAGSFQHFVRQLGLDEPQTLLLGSPFNWQDQALAWIPPGLPQPRERGYTARMIEAILPLLEASQGRAFLLFTSHRALREAATLLEYRLPFPLFVQGTAPRVQLLEGFRAAGNGVLLGAASFWEGVDVAGDALRLVVIDKLPFAAPDDPVLGARRDALEQQGISAFRALDLPNAVIALKQGAGRLIRDIHDRGVLVLCDPRLATAGYRKVFISSLPALPWARSRDDVLAFLEQLPAPAPAPSAAGDLCS